MSLVARLVTGRIVLDGKLAGTAWRCAPDLAITAAHCLRAADRSFSKACTIQFNDDTVATIGTVKHLDEKSDVAVLSLDRRGTNFVPVATASWPDVVDARWTGFGYPDAKDDGMGLSGRITHVDERVSGRGIQLLCDQGSEGQLKHASGAPVIIGNYAVAMIAWGPPALLQKVIYARTFDVLGAEAGLKPQIHPSYPLVANVNEQLHLMCDRAPQWGQFDAWVSAPPSITAFFVTGPDHEVPEKFVARIEQADRTEDMFQVRSVKWDGFPPAAAKDYLAMLSRGVFGEEVTDEALLVDRLLDAARETKLVIKHPRLNLSSQNVKRRLDDLFRYYYVTLPALFALRQPLTRDVRGVMFLQPFYWEPRGLGRWFKMFSDHDVWTKKIKGKPASPLVALPAPAFQQIDVDNHVVPFLDLHRDQISQISRDSVLREIRRYRTSAGILKVLEEAIG